MKASKPPLLVRLQGCRQTPAHRRARLRRRPKATRLLALTTILAALLCASPWYLSPALFSSAGLLLWDAKSAVVELLFTVAAVTLQRRA